MSLRFLLLHCLLLLGLNSCNTLYHPQEVQYQGYRVSGAQAADTALLQLIGPYSDSVNRSMNQVVGQAEATLEKRQPEGSLGNFMADAVLHAAAKAFNRQADAAFVNYGGIRLTQLAKGAITRGKIFELMPFDNVLVLQQLTGAQLQQFLDFTAERGGWPMSGIQMNIQDRKAVGVRVNGQPLDPARSYWIVNSDYVANGGDNALLLKGIPQQNTGYLMRDALFDYIIHLRQQGKAVAPAPDKRILNVP